MPSQYELQQLLKKYSQGKCTPEEVQLLWQWLFLLDLRDEQVLGEEEESLLRQQLHDRIFSQINIAPAGDRIGAGQPGDQINVAQPGARIIPIRGRRRRMVAAAAVIVLAVFTLFLRRDDRPFSRSATTSMIVNDTRTPITMYLPDSTKVILNKMASVTFDNNYNRKNRSVRLYGEGYFVVRKESRLPFIVQTGTVNTEALGTAFNIEYYYKESEIRVSLLQGKVRVSSGGGHRQFAYLDSGQMVRYKIPGDSLKQPVAIAASNVLAWTNGGLVFNDVPLAEALKRVEEHYHLHLEYAPSQINGKRVTTVFSDQMSWQGALSNILFLHNMHYIKKDTLIFIK